MRKIPLWLVVLGMPPLFSGLMIALPIVFSFLLSRPLAPDSLWFGFIVGWVLWQAAVVVWIVQARALRRDRD